MSNEELQQRIVVLENLLANLIYNGEYKFLKNVTFGPGAKIGLYGVPAIPRQAAITPPSSGATIDGPARAAIDTIIIDLQKIGITF